MDDLKLVELEKECASVDEKLTDCETEIECLKAEKKKLEAEREVTFSEIRKIIRGDKEDNQPSLFSPPAGSRKEREIAPGTQKHWRETTLSELGITPAVAERLTTHNLSNLGAISDFTSSGKTLNELSGIGDGKMEKIIDAIDKYWTANPPASDDATATAAREVFKPKGESKETTPAPPAPEVPSVPVLHVTEFAPDFQTQIADGFNECKDIFRLAMAGEKPKVKLLNMQDDHNRFNGKYAIVEKKDTRYRFLKTYEHDDWMRYMGEFERTYHREMAGALSNMMLRDLDRPDVEMFFSGDHECFYVETKPIEAPPATEPAPVAEAPAAEPTPAPAEPVPAVV